MPLCKSDRRCSRPWAAYAGLTHPQLRPKASAIELARIAEPPQQSRNLFRKPPPWRGLRVGNRTVSALFRCRFANPTAVPCRHSSRGTCSANPLLGGDFGREIEQFPRYFDAALQIRPPLLAALGRVCRLDPTPNCGSRRAQSSSLGLPSRHSSRGTCSANPSLGRGFGRSPQGLTAYNFHRIELVLGN